MINRTSIVFFMFIAFAFHKSRAQTVLLQVDRAIDSISSKRGPNLDKFAHGFIYIGCIAGDDKSGARIMYGPSVEFGGGARKKYKISPLYSLGWEIGVQEKIFKLKEESGKILPDTLINDVERMEFWSTYLSFYNRFNFDNHRGNYMGTFFDIGISGGWDFAITHVTKNELPNGSKITTQITSLPYVNRFTANAFARIGLSHVSAYATYRLTDLFRPAYHFPELPALSFGIELAIFRN